MKLDKFSIEKLEKIAKSLSDKEADIRSKYDVVRGYFSNEEGLLKNSWVITSKNTRIFCLEYFLTEDKAWSSLFKL